MKIKYYFERFIILAIILALVHSFLDEYSRIEHWSVSARKIILLIGLAFDFIFSIEFIVKLIFAAKEKRVSVYLKQKRGWADFCTSLPVLLLSLPSVYFAFSGQPGCDPSAFFCNILFFLKDARAARLLRFMRIIKLFGKIKISSSPMAEHHVSVICTAVVFAMVCCFFIFSLFATPISRKVIDRAQFFDESISTIKYLENKTKISYIEIAKKLFTDEKNLLKLSHKDEIIISRISDEKFIEYYTNEDYAQIDNRGFVLQYSVIDLNRELACSNIIFFIIILVASISIIVFYKKHFIFTISDVIDVVNKGFKSRQYNEPVIIRKEYEEDEVFKLAKFYNEAYLPAKLKRIEQKQKEDLKQSNN